LKPAQGNSSKKLILKKKSFKKRARGVAQGIGPEFKPTTMRNENSVMIINKMIIVDISFTEQILFIFSNKILAGTSGHKDWLWLTPIKRKIT
jgi:hypothetical protein